MAAESELSGNLKWGVGIGAAMATVYSLFVLGLSVLNGSTYWPEYRTSTWMIIAGYYVAGLGGGAVVGAIRPLTRWRIGTFFVGWIGGSIAYGAIAVATGLQRDAPWWLALIPGAGFGGLALVLQDQARAPTAARARPRLVFLVVGIIAALMLIADIAGWW